MFAFRDFFIIYFYICGVNTDCVKDMQTLLNDIELDIQELKCLIQAISNDANPALKIVAKRNIQQMRVRLDALQKLLDEAQVVVVTPIANIVQEQPVTNTIEPMQNSVTTSSSILAERIRPAASLRQAISLNDSFRFTRELFNGDASRMNEIVQHLGEAPSLDEAMIIFNSEVHLSEENEAIADFVELLKKYFS